MGSVFVVKVKTLDIYGMLMFHKRTVITSSRSLSKTHFKYLTVAETVTLTKTMFMKQLLLPRIAWLISTLSPKSHMLKEMTNNSHLEYTCNQVPCYQLMWKNSMVKKYLIIHKTTIMALMSNQLLFLKKSIRLLLFIKKKSVQN
jgi:hypothetical protein